MIPVSVIAFFMAAGLSTWVYLKMQRHNGGVTKYSLIVAGVAGFFAFILVLLLGRFLPQT